MIATLCPQCSGSISEKMKVCPYCGSSVVTSGLKCLDVNTVIKSHNGHSYIIDRFLGSGGFGITYVGRNISTNQTVAIKEYFPSFCKPTRYVDGKIYPEVNIDRYSRSLNSFIKEASMLAAVPESPSIVRVLDCFEANNTAYMAMEYLDGITLQNVVEQSGAMSFDELLPKLKVLMDDLNVLHKAKVLHRDISPSNIMLMPNGSLKLIDFGCARSTEDSQMTVMLNPEFAPIEQYTTNGQGSYTDVYALCATIYYCITGQRPPQSTERTDGTDKIINPSELGADIGETDEITLMRGLSVMPKDRPQTMKELSNGFRKLRRSETILDPESESESVSVQPSFPFGKFMLGGILALFAVLLIIAFFAANY